MTDRHVRRERQDAMDREAIDIDDVERGQIAIEALRAYGCALRAASRLQGRPRNANGAHGPHDAERDAVKRSVHAARSEVESLAVHLSRRDERLKGGFLP